MFAWFLAAAALAGDPSSLAVLPFADGGHDEAWDGLGQALSGMVTTDLVDVPALVLVERARLDVVLDELSLARRGVVDPSTAARVGRGLGADLLLQGSYTVVGDTLLLDARVVDVETSRVLGAADAQGAVTDFVAVEKELVTDLLATLDVSLDGAATRRLMLRAPTEAWEALSSYGSGLDAQRAGRLDDARAAFERAVATDPAFALATTALSELRGVLESERARQASVGDRTHADAEARVLARWAGRPWERLPADASPDARMDALVGIALTAMVLEDQQRSCERVDLQRAWLLAQGGVIAEPPRTSAGTLTSVVQARATELGYAALPEASPGAPRMSYERPTDRLRPWRDTWAFVTSGYVNFGAPPAGDLIGALRLCLTPAELPGALDALRRSLVDVGGVRQNGDRGLTLDEGLTLWSLWASARAGGASAAMTRRAEALLAGRAADDPVRAELLRLLDEVAKVADAHAASVVRRHGQDEATLVRVMQAMAAGPSDTSVRWTGGLGCDKITGQEKNGAPDWLVRFATSEGIGRDIMLDLAGRTWGELRDAGCLVGVRSPFADAADVYAFMATLPARVTPAGEADAACRAGLSALEMMSTDVARRGAASSPDTLAWSMYGLLATYHGTLVWNRCVETR